MTDERDESPPSEEELAASRRLRDALDDPSIDDPDADLARSLRAAYAPSPIAEDEHAALVDELPTAEELALGRELARAVFDDPVVVALRAAWDPPEIPEADHRAIVARAIGAAGGAEVVPFARRARVVRVAFGVVTGALALAASVVVWVSSTPPADVPLARVRSTQPLFSEPFRNGNASARIDTIAVARASDFRNNRFARWGVR